MFLKRAVAGRILLECREDTDLAGKLHENELTGTVEFFCVRDDLTNTAVLKTYFRHAVFYT